MTNPVIAIAIGLFAFAILVAYLSVKLPLSYALRWSLIPASLALALYLSVTIPDLMGRAYPKFPEKQFQYLDHMVSKDRTTIELWAKLPDGSTRLYQVPYTAKLNEQLDLAKEAAQHGVPAVGKFHKKSNAGNSGVEQDLQMEVRPNLQSMLPPK